MALSSLGNGGSLPSLTGNFTLSLPHSPGNLSLNNVLDTSRKKNPQEVSQGTLVGRDNATQETLVRETGTDNLVRTVGALGDRLPGAPIEILKSTALGTQRTPVGVPGSSSNVQQLNTSSTSTQFNQTASFSDSCSLGFGGSNSVCPVGFIPRCDQNGNCFGCIPKPEPPFEVTLTPLSREAPPDVPGDPGDGCGGPDDSCSWYEGQSCPAGTFSKGFVEFPQGVFRVLCCGGPDRDPGIGCGWQEPEFPVNVSYKCTEVEGERFCLAVYDGSGNFQTQAECEANCQPTELLFGEDNMACCGQQYSVNSVTVDYTNLVGENAYTLSYTRDPNQPAEDYVVDNVLSAFTTISVGGVTPFGPPRLNPSVPVIWTTCDTGGNAASVPPLIAQGQSLISRSLVVAVSLNVTPVGSTPGCNVSSGGLSGIQ